MEGESQGFLNHLHEEKLKAQQARVTYVLQKLAFVTSLMGLGSLDITVGKIDFSLLLYLAPWVAIAFDFYILGEDYSVKRIGAFLKEKSTDRLENDWEKWIAKNRDPFAPLATPILTTLIFLGSVLIAFQQPDVAKDLLFKIWLIVTGLPTWIAFIIYYRLRRRIYKAITQVGKQPSTLSRVVLVVEAEDHQLTDSTYNEISQLFVKCQSDPSYFQDVKKSTREYGKKEFLLCVDEDGKPTPISNEILEHFRKTIAISPEYNLWFCETESLENGSTLLIARWLCHLVGLRHRVVHMFIDHPTLEDHTLLQVRAMDKAESPGCFDLPAAGHVSGTETVEEALCHELAEELGLRTEALDDFVQVGSYNYSAPGDYQNVEFRTVYYARLKIDDWLKLRADFPEVAAITLFSIVQLHEMIASFPDCIASGLRSSFSLYLKHKLDQQKVLMHST